MTTKTEIITNASARKRVADLAEQWGLPYEFKTPEQLAHAVSQANDGTWLVYAVIEGRVFGGWYKGSTERELRSTVNGLRRKRLAKVTLAECVSNSSFIFPRI